MSRIEGTKREKRIEFVQNRLLDMDDNLANGRVSDAVRVDYVAESAKLVRELRELGVDFETPPFIVALATSKTGISAAKAAGVTGVVNVPGVTPTENLGAKEQLAKSRK